MHAPFDDLSDNLLRHPDSFKWTYHADDILPLWVADMDFPIAPSIHAALHARLDLGIGYQSIKTDLDELLRQKLHRLGMPELPAKGAISFLTGVVPGLYATVVALTQPGEEVLTFTPIYPPFLASITDHGRVAKQSPLVQGAQDWEIDFTSLDAAVTPTTRLLMLCHPHNPTGRVWSRDELSQLVDFANRHQLFVVSDELHADLTLDGPFIPFTAVADEHLRMRTVTLTGPCKAYNTAGLGIVAMISHNRELITRIKKAGAGLLGHAGTMSITMWRAALNDDGVWLASVLDYLRANRTLLEAFVRERLPLVDFIPPQATYLAWLDFRRHPRAGDIHQHLLKDAKVGLNDGPQFGEGYQGFVRINFATSRAILTEALERIACTVA